MGKRIAFSLDVANIGPLTPPLKGSGPVPRLSHPVEEVCHRFLILLKGSEAVSEASGHLTGARLCFGQIATLGQDLDFVRVGSGFVHVANIGPLASLVKGPGPVLELV